MALLDIRNLVVRYGEIEALRGVTIAVEAGQVVTLLGANGAGDRSHGHLACTGRTAGVPWADGEGKHHAWRVEP